nr:uncharacterized protein LOC111416098 isoform X1 [Onthophagus taurus]XP_022903815.1 uncharacterized protein LOC111416098 isoform X1 [Onthophagus taurus]
MNDSNRDHHLRLKTATIHCPWTSNAPITATTSCKTGGKCSENCHVPPKTPSNYSLRTSSSWCLKTKPTITYFNNFVRLMQLFPEMHPASLHTALSMCKNEFVSSVDRLLYVRKYRNGNVCNKREDSGVLNKKIQRKNPHFCYYRKCDEELNEEVEDVFEREVEMKRTVYNNNKSKIKCNKTVIEKKELTLQVSTSEEQEDVVVGEEIVQDLSQTKSTR